MVNFELGNEIKEVAFFASLPKGFYFRKQRYQTYVDTHSFQPLHWRQKKFTYINHKLRKCHQPIISITMPLLEEVKKLFLLTNHQIVNNNQCLEQQYSDLLFCKQH